MINNYPPLYRLLCTSILSIGFLATPLASAQTAASLVCAAYANNATALYVKLDTAATIDRTKFLLGAGSGTSINQNNVEQLVTTLSGATQVGSGTIYKITVAARTAATTVIQYKDGALSVSATCNKETTGTSDADNDQTPDISDRNPFVDHPPTLRIESAEAIVTARPIVERRPSIRYVFKYVITADEPVPSLLTLNSYSLTGIHRDNSLDLSHFTFSKVTGTTMRAVVTGTQIVERQILNPFRGFVLSRRAPIVANALEDRTGKAPVNSDGELIVDPTLQAFPPIAPLTQDSAVAVTAAPLECAALNTAGQNVLYLIIDGNIAKIDSFTTVRTAGFTIGNQAVPATSVTPLRNVDNGYGAVRIALSDTVNSAQTVSYKHTAQATAITGNCKPSTTADWDLDGIPDINDPFPFIDTPPVIKVVAVAPPSGKQGFARETARSGSNITYSLKFEVIASETVKHQTLASSYVLMRVPKVGNPVVVSGAPVPTVATVTGKDHTVSLSYSGVQLARAMEPLTAGYTVGLSTATNNDALEGDDGRSPTRDGTAVISNNQPIAQLPAEKTAIALAGASISCAAYANNATELYIRIDIADTVDRAKFFLGGGSGTAIGQSAVMQLPGGAPIYRITVTALTGASTIIQYKAGTITASATCMRNTTADIDSDQTPDSSDSNPFADNPPTLRIISAEATETMKTNTAITYQLRYIITADEPVASLNKAGSYNVIAVDLGGNLITRVVTESNGTLTATGNDRRATVTVSGVRASIANLRNIRGFILQRDANPDTSLRDRTGNLPIDIDGKVLLSGLFEPFPPIAPLRQASAVALLPGRFIHIRTKLFLEGALP